MKLKELAERLGLTLLGDGEVEIRGVGSLLRAGEDELSFIGSNSYLEQARKSRAGALIVKEESWAGGKPALISSDPYRSFVQAETILHPEPEPVWGIHGTAVIGEEVKISQPVWIGPYVIIERGCEIGARARIEAHCYLGEGVKIGEETHLYPGVKVLERCEVGKRCIIHSGVVIGSDGFGFLVGEAGHEKIPQIGKVIIEDNVEIGANCAIDRASLDETVIGSGTKLDNLVHIAHSVRVGKNCIILAGTVIGGSTEIGDGCLISGNVTIKDHIKIGAGSQIVGTSGVLEDLEPGSVVWGMPAMPFSRAKRVYLRLKQLPELFHRVKKLEEKLEKS